MFNTNIINSPEETSNRDADAGLPAWEPKDEVMTEELQAETGAAESIVYVSVPLRSLPSLTNIL